MRLTINKIKQTEEWSKNINDDNVILLKKIGVGCFMVVTEFEEKFTIMRFFIDPSDKIRFMVDCKNMNAVDVFDKMIFQIPLNY